MSDRYETDGVQLRCTECDVIVVTAETHDRYHIETAAHADPAQESLFA